MGKIDEVLSRPATVVFNSRADARYLATALAFWHELGEKPRSVSELVRVTMETFVDLMISNNKAKMVASQDIAFEMFERAGILNQKMRELNQKNLRTAIVNENVNLSAIKGVDPLGHHKLTPAQVGKGSDLSAAVAALESNMEVGMDERVSDAQGRTQEFKKSMGVVPKEGSDE